MVELGLNPLPASLALAIGSETILAGFLIGAGFLLILAGAPGARRWLQSRRASRRGTKPNGSSGARSRDARAIARDIEEVTRLCAAQLDKRAARIEALLERADIAIARLEELGEDLAESASAEGETRIGVRRVRHGAGTRRGEPMAFSTSSDVDPLVRQIYQLADSGKNPVEIAGELEEQVGKVELILALRG